MLGNYGDYFRYMDNDLRSRVDEKTLSLPVWRTLIPVSPVYVATFNIPLVVVKIERYFLWNAIAFIRWVQPCAATRIIRSNSK